MYVIDQWYSFNITTPVVWNDLPSLDVQTSSTNMHQNAYQLSLLSLWVDKSSTSFIYGYGRNVISVVLQVKQVKLGITL